MSGLAADPGRVEDLARALREGSLTSQALVRRCLDRIAAVDGEVQAFVAVLADAALASARERDAELSGGAARGKLHGIPFAVKDVIDIEGLPTRAGSRARADVPPAAADATIVAHLRAAGAVLLGKVHTTEFAYFTGPPPTRNPHDLSRTPGGSSAGSAAAVAAGMVPLAIGTQTAGSVNRPAAYCGIGCFKPSTLGVPATGIVPFAPSFDTAGAFAARASDAAVMAEAFAPAHLRMGADAGDGMPVRVAVLLDPLLDRLADPCVAPSIRALASSFREAGVAVDEIASPVPLDAVLQAHRTVMLAEVGRVHRGLPRGLVDPQLAADIEAGLAVPDGACWDAMRQLDAARAAFWRALDGRFALMPAAPSVAPAGMATGNPAFIIPATALGGPVAGLRAGTDPSTGMPLGAMLMAAPGEDGRLAAFLRSNAGRALGL
jgi:aspartyl-tRNA(Asn)/glutamyl-tRNA(Gln) amidotransferase subunit A